MVVNRRQFLLTSVAASAPAANAYAPLLAGQVYVWTQQFREQNLSLRDGVEGMIAGFRGAGYRRVEIISSFLEGDVGPLTLATGKKHGIEFPIVYNGQPLHDPATLDTSIDTLLTVADSAKAAGAGWINCNPSPKPKGARKSDEELATQAKALNRLAAELKKKGMSLMVHQHDPEMKEDAREWRHIARNTDPSLVRFCLDTHWVYRGGQDPHVLLREAGTRLAALHLRNSRGGIWTESIGDGDIDYRRVAAYLKEIGFQGYLVVELAVEKGTERSRPLEENLRISREYAEKVFG